MTVIGGKGNDYIYNSFYDDYIGGFYDSIDGGIGNDTISNWGLNDTVDGGAGNDSIDNWGEKTSINGGEDADYIENRGENSTLNGGNGNDTIYNYYGDNSYIDGGKGDDSINNDDGANSTILGGSGNDTINNSDSQVTIDAGAGNDSIWNSYGDNVSISGGDGDDFIYHGSYDFDYKEESPDYGVLNDIHDLNNDVDEVTETYTKELSATVKAATSALKKIKKNLPEGVTAKEVTAVQKKVSKSSKALKVAEKLTDLATIVENAAKAAAWMKESYKVMNLGAYCTDHLNVDIKINNYLDNYYEWRDLPLAKSAEKTRLTKLYAPNPENYTEYYSRADDVKKVLKSNKNIRNKVSEVGKIVTNNKKYNLNKISNGVSKLELIGLGLSAWDFGLNMVDTQDERAIAANEAQAAALLDKWHVYNEAFKAQSVEKYDSFNLSAWNLIGAGVGIGVGIFLFCWAQVLWLRAARLLQRRCIPQLNIKTQIFGARSVKISIRLTSVTQLTFGRKIIPTMSPKKF